MKHCFAFTILLSLFLLAPTISRAEHDYPRCTDVLPRGTECRQAVETLHPTQPDVGKHEVKAKRNQFEALARKSAKDFEKLKVEKVVPVIVGPDGNLYLVDHHHTSLALWESGEQDVYVKVLENWSDLAPGNEMPVRMEAFWNKMKEHQYCYLYAEDGTFIDPMSLFFPRTLKDCGNNRYRALASMLIEKGLIADPHRNYFEFYVAEELRKLGVEIPPGHLKKAVKIAKAKLATPEGKAAMERAAAPRSGNCFLNQVQNVVAP